MNTVKTVQSVEEMHRPIQYIQYNTNAIGKMHNFFFFFFLQYNYTNIHAPGE